MVAKKPRKIRKRKYLDGKFYTPRGIELTRCSHTMTESEFWNRIKRIIDRASIRWGPKIQKMHEGRRESQSDNKRLKWEYSCETCLGWFPSKDIDMDHIVPKGGLTSPEGVERYIVNTFVEIEGYQRLCKKCHKDKTKNERKDNG